ncbi:MAG: DNA alkylation repair protein [Planctomycetes bacterium]|nr:DNA alkylation repair protein [Planctomycetota bacterium]
MNDASRSPRRKGASRMADIPAAILRELEAGRMETATLVEWLAIDVRKLAHALAEAVDFGGARAAWLADVEAAAELGVAKRNRAIGVALHRATQRKKRAFEACARHTSDMVRAWAAYASPLGDGRPFADRLAAVQRFAADGSMATRESAWDAWRPFLAEDVPAHLPELAPWVRNADANIRRCAIEGSRPRGVWTAQLRPLVERPELAADLLEVVRADPARYVQLSVGNWLNDAGKSRPEWVRELTSRWSRESKHPATAFLVKRALRNLA